MPTGYIYLLTNLLDSKCYVGQTTKTPEQRWHDHIAWSRTQRVYLSHAIRKHGPVNFALQLVAVVNRDSENELKVALDQLEKLWIICLRSCESAFGYNMTFGGEGGVPTEAVRQKISKANRGRKWTPELRERIVRTRSLKPHPNKEVKLSPERIAALTAARLAKGISPETRKRWSDAGKRQKQSVATRKKRSENMSGDKNPMFGRKGPRTLQEIVA
jgi:group I intron endonuclease